MNEIRIQYNPSSEEASDEHRPFDVVNMTTGERWPVNAGEVRRLGQSLQVAEQAHRAVTGQG